MSEQEMIVALRDALSEERSCHSVFYNETPDGRVWQARAALRRIKQLDELIAKADALISAHATEGGK